MTTPQLPDESASSGGEPPDSTVSPPSDPPSETHASIDWSVHRRRQRTIVFVALALIVFGLFLFGFVERPVHWPTTTGTVGSVGIEASGAQCIPVIDYTVNQQQYTFVDWDDASAKPCPFSQGETVRFEYNPAQPSEGSVVQPGSNRTKHFYLAATLFVVAGLVVGCVGFVWDRRQLRLAAGPRVDGGAAAPLNADPRSPAIHYGGITFAPPRAVRRESALLRIAVLLAFALWGLFATWSRQPAVAVLTCLVFLELALAAIRGSRFVGGVIFSEDLAHRIAAPVREVFSLAGYQAPRVVLKDRVSPSASMRAARGSPRLVLSAELLAELDDRQVRALVAHEAMHVVMGDVRRAQRRGVSIWLLLMTGYLLVVFKVGLWFLPTFLAVTMVLLVLARIPVGLMNRHRESQADADGARLIGDPAGMASALDAVYRHSDAYRSKVFGPQPWRVLLWPLSWRPPSHPPRERRLAALSAIATETAMEPEPGSER